MGRRKVWDELLEKAEARNKVNRERRLHDPDLQRKYESRKVFAAAVCRGDLTRPEDCERCGSDNEGRTIEGHHPDYDKPLEVEWLCLPCHRSEHPRVGGSGSGHFTHAA